MLTGMMMQARLSPETRLLELHVQGLLNNLANFALVVEMEFMAHKLTMTRGLTTRLAKQVPKVKVVQMTDLSHIRFQ